MRFMTLVRVSLLVPGVADTIKISAYALIMHYHARKNRIPQFIMRFERPTTADNYDTCNDVRVPCYVSCVMRHASTAKDGQPPIPKDFRSSLAIFESNAGSASEAALISSKSSFASQSGVPGMS